MVSEAMSTERLRAGGAGAIRVGDAERDQVTSALHEHFVQGRLTRDELDERLEAALSARTVGDLRAVTRDLPADATADLSPLPSAAHGGGEWPHGRQRGLQRDLRRGLQRGLQRGPLGARSAWAVGGAYRGRGPLAPPWADRPHRGHGFAGVAARLVIAAFVIAAFAGGWAILPVFALGWLALTFFGVRHARRWHHPGAPWAGRPGR
jgi:hypothetical protein